MRDALNNLGINNSTGRLGDLFDEHRQTFDNDNPHYINEDPLINQKEIDTTAESYADINASSEDVNINNVDVEISSETSTATSSASSSASSSAASVSGSLGGGIGALTGVVAATVVTAVTVVAVFLSTLSISLSLVLAKMNSLIFEVKITGAQEEDFATPIYAVLTGDDDVYQEQIVDPNRLTIEFDNLQPGTRYHVEVKNENKVFFESYYFTSTTPSENGDIVSRMEGNEVFVSVQNVSLKKTEFYTLVAKDAQGNIVYQKDGIEVFAEYQFTIDAPKNLYFYLMVNGKTYAVNSFELPEYDFENATWTWGDNNLTATVTFADKRGGESLVLNAVVTRKITEATCEEDGKITYTANAVYEGQSFSQQQTTIIDALGHEYEGTYEDGHFTFVCSRCGDSYSDEDNEP